MNGTQRQSVRIAFENHPLLQVCDKVLYHRLGVFESLNIQAEDIFFEAADVLDELLSTPQMTLKDVDRLWSSVVNDVRGWKTDATEKDKMLTAGTVFLIVRKLLMHHWNSCYCDTLYSLVDSTLNEEMKVFDEKEHTRFLEDLFDCSEELDEWINGYDIGEGFLSEEIADVFSGKKDKPVKRSGRKAIDPRDVQASFDYQYSGADKNARLVAFYNSLKGVFIANDTDQKVFIDIFQNVTTTDKIVWIRTIRELKYLFNKLTQGDNPFIKFPSKYSKWVMVCARFQILVRNKEGVDDSLTDDSFNIEDLKKEQFTKDSENLTSHEELDSAIKILDPRFQVDLPKYMSSSKGLKDYGEAAAHGLRTKNRT